jgi:hypothetical protein
VEHARSIVDACRRAVDALEKYKQKAKNRYLQEIAYREELEQDEIGNVMHLNRRVRI